MSSSEEMTSAAPRDAVSISSVNTLYSACSVEFCPTKPDMFVCGTYQIQKDESTTREEDGIEVEAPKVERFGRGLIYQIDGRNLIEKQRFDCPAILDMKWFGFGFLHEAGVSTEMERRRSTEKWNDKTTLAVADAKGNVQLHGSDDETGQLSLTQNVVCASPETLCLSLDWSDRRPSSSPTSIVVSLSDGNICTLGGETEMKITNEWKGHDFEPWVAAFDCWESKTVWTGGDDCKLKGWDLRQGCDTPTFVNKRFEGGVTTIQSHPLLPNLFVVGSYDSSIRLFDKRKPLSPLLTYDVGGGIWRLKWHPTNPSRLLIAAMHGGFRVVDFENLNQEAGGEAAKAEVKTRFDEHESLAYGVDWSRGGTDDEGRDWVASCSFYDSLVHVWSV